MTIASEDSTPVGPGDPTGTRHRWSLLLTGVVVVAVVAAVAVLMLGGRGEPVVDLREIGQLNPAVIAAVDHQLETAPVPVGPDGQPMPGRAQSSICVPTGSPSTFLCTVQFTDAYEAVLLEVIISDDARTITGMRERPAY